MSTTPVHWGAYPGELLEEIMAVFVAQDHPKTLRRTPSRGDGGVDLLVPVEGGFHVKQVKGFSDRIGSSERRQIRESYESLLNDPRLDQPVVEWRLTVPVDPTSGEQEWFNDLTADAPFDVWWDGELYWHKLAADHPHVIDYYIGGGKDRVVYRAKALLESTSAVDTPLTPLDVSGRLAILAANLNKDDPHYSYEFETRGSSSLEIPLRPRPGAVLSVTAPMTDGGSLVTHVVAKHRYSTTDAPIGGTLTARIVDPDLGIDLRDDVGNFLRYGAALEFPMGSVDMTMNAPGGLGGSVEGAAARLGPAVSKAGAKKFRIRVAHGDSGETHTLELFVQQTTRGEVGLKSLMYDRHRHLRIEFTIDFVGKLAGRCNMNFNVEDILLAPVDDIVEVVRFIAAIQPGNVLELLPEHGEKILATAHIGNGFASIDPETATMVEDLHTLQTYVADTVLLPDLVSEASLADLSLAAALIRERRLVAHNVTFNTENPSDQEPESYVQKLNSDRPITVHNHLQVRFKEGLAYDVGTVFMVGTQLTFAEYQPSDPKWLTLVLFGDAKVTVTLDDPEENPPEDVQNGSSA